MARRTGLIGLAFCVSIFACGAARGDEAPPPPPPPPPSVDCAPTCVEVAACCPRWRLSVLGSASRLTDDPSGPLGEPVGAGPTQISWDALSYDWAPGLAVSLSMEGACSTVTARGTYYGRFEDSAADSGVYGGRATPADPVVASLPFDADLSEQGDLWGVELSWTRRFGCACGWTLEGGLGIRYLRFDENATADLSPPPPTTGGPSPSASSDVTNSFVGAEVVGVVRRSFSPCFEIGLEARAFVGWIDRQTDIEDSDVFSGGAHSASDRSDGVAFGGEVDLTASWRVSRGVSLVLGAGILTLTDVQRAHRAMDFSNAASGQVGAVSDDVDSILVKRVFAGLTFDF